MSDFLAKGEFWDASADVPTDVVDLFHPVTGQLVGRMHMRGLRGDELEAYQKRIQATNGKRVSFKNAISTLIVMSAINEDGSQFFDPRESMRVSQSPSWMLMPLFETAGKLSGVSEDDVKELTEDFDDAQSEPSSSGSL